VLSHCATAMISFAGDRDAILEAQQIFEHDLSLSAASFDNSRQAVFFFGQPGSRNKIVGLVPRTLRLVLDLKLSSDWVHGVPPMNRVAAGAIPATPAKPPGDRGASLEEGPRLSCGLIAKQDGAWPVRPGPRLRICGMETPNAAGPRHAARRPTGLTLKPRRPDAVSPTLGCYLPKWGTPARPRSKTAREKSCLLLTLAGHSGGPKPAPSGLASRRSRSPKTFTFWAMHRG